MREAVQADVDAIVELIESKRVQLAAWEPNFWRKAEGSADMSRAFLSGQIEASEVVLLVADDTKGLAGCLQAKPTFVPPVYSPTGTTWMVDDFVVTEGAWDTAGAALLQALKLRTIGQQAGQLIFPVPHKDVEAASFFETHGLSPTTVWWTLPHQA
ncbi:MAG: hypothetical protein QNI84_07075 [Henriciella sp.]|nr:hypothetical protein [Henriciella sp.]